VKTADLKQAVARAAAGDEAAASLLFDTYYPRVYRYALSKLRSHVDAEDVAAATFAKIVAELGRFRWKGGGFEPWLFRIAYNVIVDHVRSRSREAPSAGDLGLGEYPDDHTPESKVIEFEMADELRVVLDRLVPEQREVLVLRFAAGLASNEIARVMKKNPNAVRQLQFRALRNLRHMMQDRVGAA
jgi:RNA polymerase sigma factor (sigma-70 family)